MRLWKRPGITVMRRVPSQKTITRTMVASIWIRLMRVTGTPRNSVRIGGKNSSIEGPWNSPPSSAVWAISVAARVNSAGSSFGATEESVATMVGERHTTSAQWG